MAKKYLVQLTGEEQEELKGLVYRGRAAAYKQTHARILLLCDENQTGGAMRDQEIARALRVGTPRWNGCAAAAWRRELEGRPGTQEAGEPPPRKLDGEGEAHLVALACSQPPEGRAGWTLQSAG